MFKIYFKKMEKIKFNFYQKNILIILIKIFNN